MHVGDLCVTHVYVNKRNRKLAETETLSTTVAETAEIVHLSCCLTATVAGSASISGSVLAPVVDGRCRQQSHSAQTTSVVVMLFVLCAISRSRNAPS